MHLDIVVIGASAGGIASLVTLVSNLPANLDAAVFIVQHLSPHSPGYFADILKKAAHLPVKGADNDTPISMGSITVAPKGLHLFLDKEDARVVGGAAENRSRPSIDVLFRSAAIAHRNRVIGVILSGLMDDGTAGLRAIKQCGGLAIVQDPSDALYSEMPESALRSVETDFCVPLSAIGGLITKLVSETIEAPKGDIPTLLQMEAEFSRRSLGIEDMKEIGEKTDFNCPTCSGDLWLINDVGEERYRCHLGHAFSANGVLKEQFDNLERSIEVAMRLLREHSALLRRMAARIPAALPHRSSPYEKRAESFDSNADELGKLLDTMRHNPEIYIAGG